MGLYLLSVAALSMSDAQMASYTPDMTKLDLRFGYDRAQALALLTALGEGGRRAYALNLVIDTFMPVALAAALVTATSPVTAVKLVASSWRSRRSRSGR